MKAFERRVKELEKKMVRLPPPSGLTPSQQLTAERFVRLLVQGKKIPKTLQKQHDKLPPPEEIGPGVQEMIDTILGVNGDGKEGRK